MSPRYTERVFEIYYSCELDISKRLCISQRQPAKVDDDDDGKRSKKKLCVCRNRVDEIIVNEH